MGRHLFQGQEVKRGDATAVESTRGHNVGSSLASKMPRPPDTAHRQNAPGGHFCAIIERSNLAPAPYNGISALNDKENFHV